MPSGLVKWFNVDKGYGFIKNDEGGDDLFVHHSEIVSTDERKSLQDGQRVKFSVKPDPKNNRKLCATNVQAD